MRLSPGPSVVLHLICVQSLLCPAGAGPGGLNAGSGEQNPATGNPATGSGLKEVGVIPQGARQWALNFDPVLAVPQLPPIYWYLCRME